MNNVETETELFNRQEMTKRWARGEEILFPDHNKKEREESEMKAGEFANRRCGRPPLSLKARQRMSEVMKKVWVRKRAIKQNGVGPKVL